MAAPGEHFGDVPWQGGGHGIGFSGAASGVGDEPATPQLQTAVSSQSLECQPQPEAGDDHVDNIRVYVRVRPATEREQIAAPQSTLAVDFPTHSVLLRGDQPRTFTFDGVLGEDSTQEEVFDLVGRGIGASCLAGYNGSVYVYGQTGVGKTYTMSGPVTSVQSMQFDDRRGLICRVLEYVFAEIHRRKTQQSETGGSSYLCRCSFLEIYKEQITDLLEPNNTNLQVREDMNRGVYVERLSEPIVSSLTEAFQHLWRGLQQRHIGATHMNERSSRSHAVFTLSVEVAKTRAGVTSTRVAHLSLVDLAGSERQPGMLDPRSGVSAPYQSVRVKEAGAINRSLSALTNVIMSLSRDERSRRRSNVGSSTAGTDTGRRPFVHYRDSKLTFLLRDSLGGNSKTVIVANISPSSLCLNETISTLKFAARAKHIRCAAVRNEEFSGTVESLMQEVKLLRMQLTSLSGSGSPGLNTDRSVASLPETSTVSGSGHFSDDNEKVLYSRRRVRRLEVLLAAALERESCADHRRHQLHRLAEFLEDLDFRKTQDMKKLEKEYALHAADMKAVLVAPDNEEGQDVVEKFLGFRQLLTNLAGASAGIPDASEGAVSPRVPPSLAPQPGAASDLSDALAPTGVSPHPRSKKQGAPQSSTRAAGGGSSACGPQVAELSSDLADEAVFLRDENQRLRQQLEHHPEIGRLISENDMLRQRLRALDPGSAGHQGSLKQVHRSPSNSSDDEDPHGCENDPTGGPLTSAILLRSAESDDDNTLRTWVYFQKMAKEVEELLRAKECLASIVSEAKQSEALVAESRRSAHGSRAGGAGSAKQATAVSKAVDPEVVQELAQSTQDALQLAQAIIDSRVDDVHAQQSFEGLKTNALDEVAGHGGAPGGTADEVTTAGRAADATFPARGLPEKRRHSYSTPHLPSMHQGKTGLLGFLARDKSKGQLFGGQEAAAGGGNAAPLHSTLAALAAGAQAMTSPRVKEPVDKVQLRQAIQRVKQLHGTLDMVSSLYTDAYDQFQSVREEYENRVEECQFLELQCSRLDMHCHELADRLHGTGTSVRAGMGSFSATGLSPLSSPLKHQKRSFSLSSLRDVNFWEQRFQELSQLTGIEEGDLQHGPGSPGFARQHQHASLMSAPASAPGTGGHIPGPAKSQVLAAAVTARADIAAPVGTLSSRGLAVAPASQPTYVTGLSHSTSLSVLPLSSSGCSSYCGGAAISERRPCTERIVRRVASAPQLPVFGDMCAGRPVLPGQYFPGCAGTVPMVTCEAGLPQQQATMPVYPPLVVGTGIPFAGKQMDPAAEAARPPLATFLSLAQRADEKAGAQPVQYLLQPGTSPAASPASPQPGLVGGGAAGAMHLAQKAPASSTFPGGQSRSGHVPPVSVPSLSTRSSDGGHAGGSSGSVSARSAATSVGYSVPSSGTGAALSGGGAAGSKAAYSTAVTTRPGGTAPMSAMLAGVSSGMSTAASAAASASVAGGLRPLARNTTQGQRSASRGVVRPRTLGSSSNGSARGPLY